MKKTGIVLTIFLILAAMLLNTSIASAATDGFYQLSEVSQPVWDSTFANRTKAPTADYDYTYGDEASVTYTLPWSFSFYGQSYSQINADTNGNIWFGATGSAHSFNLATTGRGPVIAAWNNDLSSYFYGGVYIQHKTNPERVVIEWQTETYSDEGAGRTNKFAVVIFPNGTIRTDYGAFNPSIGKDFGSGISKGDGTSSLNITTTYGNAYSLAGRSFLFASGKKIYVASQTENFGNVSTGTSQPHSIILFNGGSDNLLINAATLTANSSGMFSLAAGGDGCSGNTLAPSQSCTVQVVFSPTALGPQSASLSISSNDAATPTLDVTLNGSGAHPALTVTKTDSGSGTVTSSPAGISCGSACTGSFTTGSTVTLTASPAIGSVFTGWSGACSGTGGCTVSMDAAKNVTASFTPTSAPTVLIASPSGNITSKKPVLQYNISTGTAVVKVDGSVVNKASGDVLDTLSEGTHLIRVEVTNKAGYTAFAESAVTVDTVPPAIASVTPASGAQNVLVNSAIVLTFNEALNTASITKDSIVLSSSFGPVPCSVSVSTDAKTVTFKPLVQLGYKRDYTVSFNSRVEDLTGNASPINYTATFKTETASTDLVGLWHMDGDWSDASGNGRHGTASGGATFSLDRVNGTKAGSFDGIDDYVTVLNTASLNPATISVEAWVKSGSPLWNSDGSLISKRDAYILHPISNSKEIRFYIMAGGTWRSVSVNDQNLDLTQWHHYVGTFDGAALKLYVDGVLKGTTAYSGSISTTDTGSLYIGWDDGQAGMYFKGFIDRVAIFNRGLAASEVLSQYDDRPKVSLTSQGLTLKYKSGETGTATVTVTHPVGVTSLTCSASGAASGNLSLSFDSPQTQVTRDFNIEFAPNATAYAAANITCNSVDASNNMGSATINLAVADITVPMVFGSSIVDNATNVSATKSITVNFSKAMAQASANASSVTLTVDDGTNKMVAGVITLSADQKSISFTPTGALVGRTPYRFIVSTAVTDIAGNPLVEDFVLHFTTDSILPMVIGSSITDNATNISATKSIVVNFSEPLAQTSVNSSSVTLTINDGTNKKVEGAIVLSSDQMSITFTPTAALDGNTPYRLTVSTSVTDIAQNPLAEDFVLHFTTNPAATVNISGKGTSSAPYVISGDRYTTISIDSSYVVADGPITTESIILLNGSVLTSKATGLSGAERLDVTATTVTIDATSKIDVSGKGYLGSGQAGNPGTYGRTVGNTTTGGSNYYSGGSYGGLGGMINGSQVNAVYGDPSDPNDVGSGGGGSGAAGSNGGGLIRLKAGSLVVNGSILSDGGGTTGGGGSGGGIRLDVGTLSGSGTISAKGGTSSSGWGGGGGGRIAIYFGDKTTFNGSLTAVTGGGAKRGSAGTIYWQLDGQASGEIIIDNGGIMDTPATLAVGRYGNITVRSTTLIPDGPITAESITLLNGSVLTSKSTGLNGAERLDVTATTLTIDTTSKIDVSAKGYLGSNQAGNPSTYGRTVGNTTTGGSNYYSGGSYGGLGGMNNSNQVNAVYGDPSDPNDVGSGGGGSGAAGSNGGGLIRLKAGSLVVNGSILSDGGGTTGGGGSGGGIRLDVGTLSGSGTISAKGGTSSSGWGGGGGGRIAIYYDTLNFVTSSIVATGGTGANNGGPGSIYLKGSSVGAPGNLLVDNRGIDTGSQLTPLAGIGKGTVLLVAADSLKSTLAAWQPGALKGLKFNPNTAQDKVFTIINNTADTLYINQAEGDLSQVTAAGNTFTGVFAVDAVTITGLARIQSVGRLVVSNELVVDGAGLYTANNDIVADKVTVKNNGLISHLGATTNSVYKLELNALTLLTIDATSKIDVSGKGYLGSGQAGNPGTYGRTVGNTTTGGSNYYSGGSYGGLGGMINGSQVNAVYGDPSDPNDVGSGGGGSGAAGSNGGGLIRLKAGSLVVNGSILSDGGGTTGGGGSGGGIRLDVGTLSGSGTISAKGGTSSSGWGGGGGGRIAIYYDTLNFVTSSIVATGGTGAKNGGVGTVLITTKTMPLIITETGTGSGTITSTPAGIFCGAACTNQFATLSTVTLSASPAPGSTFTGWSGACTGVGSCTVTMDAAKNVTATFAQIPPPTVIITSPSGYVKTNRPLLQYTASSGTVVVKVDGVVVNKVSGDYLDLLPDNSHNVYVEATNAGGHGSAISSFTVDTVPPTLTVNPVPTPTTTPSLTLTGTVEAGANLNVSANTAATVGPISFGVGTWSCTVSNLAPGSNTFTITALDQATNNKTVNITVTYEPTVALDLSTTSIAADYQGTVGITISNINPAASEILIEQLVDANQNGVADAGDYVIRSFKVTDGTAVTNPNMQGDTDGTANGTVTTTLNYFLTSDLYHTPGYYLFRATKGTQTSVVPFTVTSVSQTQTIAGMVTDGNNPISGALVQLTDKWQRRIAYAVADASGSYVLNVKQSGNYNLLPVAYGYVATATPVTLAASQNIVNLNLSLTAGINHLTGNVKDATTGLGIAGIWVQAGDGNNTGIAITNSTGVYDLLLPAGQYSVSTFAGATGPGAFAKGYADFNKQPLNITVNGNMAATDISLPVGDKAVTGRVLDITGNPVPGMPVMAKINGAVDSREPVSFGISDASGNYTLGLFSGTNWDISLDNTAEQTLEYLGTVHRDLSTTVGPLSGNDLTVHPITAWVQGVVKNSANQLLSGVEVKLRNSDSSIIASVVSASDGTYRLGAYAGNWFIDALTENKGTHSVTEQTFTLVDGQQPTSIDFIVDVTPPPMTVNPVTTPTTITSQTITGTMENGATVTITVTGASVGPVSYPTGTTWSCNISGLIIGDNTITVTAMDAAGNPTTLAPHIMVTVPTYTITASTDPNGSINPAGVTTVTSGGNQTYTITPNAGYRVASVTVDGVAKGAITTYTFTNVTATHTIAATFAINTYTITATAGSGGTITPTSVTVNSGASQTFTITPSSGYNVASVTVDGVSQGAVTSYTLTNITATHTVAATFVRAFNITVTSGSNGTISPSGTVAVSSGASQTFTITPNANYHVATVTVDGVAKGAITSYTFTNVTATHTIAATFAINTYTITATAGTGGTISPTSATVNYGASQTFTITPSSGYKVASVTVDGVSQGALTSYTLTNVTATHTIAATFVKTFNITVTAGSGGTISPSGTVAVNSGASQTFTITPNANYHIASVTVDGVAKGAITSYTFTNVTATHTIAATFAINTNTITATAGTGGTISPTSATVNFGASQTFTITPSSGYKVASVTVDGISQGAVTSYTFTNVTATHTITATFVKAFNITATAGTNGTISPSGTVAVSSGASQTFTITPKSGRTISSVTVDGVSKGAITSYTFTNVTATHTIAATFK